MKEIIGGIYLKINIVNIIKLFISVLFMPIALIIGITILLIATQYSVHEALWKNKESKD